jgi:hypothetical protein
MICSALHCRFLPAMHARFLCAPSQARLRIILLRRKSPPDTSMAGRGAISKRWTVARLSLTKSQVSARPGIELLALCQTITGDGSLSDAEIGQLRDWLAENREGELPAIGFLTFHR